jgi:hypothetical protein
MSFSMLSRRTTHRTLFGCRRPDEPAVDSSAAFRRFGMTGLVDRRVLAMLGLGTLLGTLFVFVASSCSG